ncbi:MULTISPECIES: type-F conjugative transfer system protein TraW [Sphingomonadaceae]|uniref:Type-F conjugative transfer system protein TraW n=1 Tax=Rhizorhabdus wittichii TaxID=160791 RepID=A0A975D8I7_9SPHN|nr:MULTISPECIES: type-F conjugative transfer system protein TraW [Sphingomonadaceae]QTH24768.1 type-F conjugative transfer system protein TraW [Rhizorhabdus wittichii]QUM74485.1 type-F conjugative transfer system protein TraW [Sphingopyxis granuli]
MVGTGLLIAVGATASTQARDYGTQAQAFPIIEPDLLATIEARLARLQSSGQIDALNQQFARRVEQSVRRPKPVAGITPATRERSWQFDPAMVVERDIRDQKGNLIAAAGQRVNPLDFVTVRQALVFVDGDDARQMAWATGRWSATDAKIILVAGSPIDEMTNRKRRFYFDQNGVLTERFGIRHTPAVVNQAGKVMQVSEHVLPRREAK